jgi:tRNA(fMet)-specific endonuclease VapC
VSELQFGINKRDPEELTQRVEGLLNTIQVLNFKAPAECYYGEIHNSLQKSGIPIDSNDLFIATHAMAENLVLVTDNTKEFQRVSDLQLENWMDS